MKSKFIKRLSIVLTVAIMAISMISVSASAKSLADSFYSGTRTFCTDADLLGCYYEKICWAGTQGYSGRHYVRAMIGSGSNAWADTGRTYSFGDIKRTCGTGPVLCNGMKYNFPTGYGYYGR